nr:TPA_asm: nucleocapsid [Alternaria tenuissima negative-stranded RNA virus 2]
MTGDNKAHAEGVKLAGKHVVNLQQLVEISLTPEFKKEIASLVGDIQDKVIYDGFNVDRFAEHLMKIHEAKKDFWKNVVRAVAIGMLRGNLRTDTLKKTSGEGQTIINEVISFFDVKLRKDVRDRATLTAFTVTFTRMVTAFPTIAYTLLTKENPLDGRITLNNRWGVNELPRAMRFSSFPSLISKSPNEVKYPLLKAHFAFSCSFDIEINGKDEPDYAKVGKFALLAASYSQQNLDLTWLKDGKILDKDGHPVKSIMNVVKALEGDPAVKIPSIMAKKHKAAESE